MYLPCSADPACIQIPNCMSIKRLLSLLGLTAVDEGLDDDVMVWPSVGVFIIVAADESVQLRIDLIDGQ